MKGNLEIDNAKHTHANKLCEFDRDGEVRDLGLSENWIFLKMYVVFVNANNNDDVEKERE